jgi:hypothetical protein
VSKIASYSDIFDFIEIQEANYKQPIKVNDRWNWSMKDHILTTDLYTHSQLLNGKTEFTPVKNVTKPILDLQHRTEDIELKEVQLYVDDPDKYHLSFLVKKYHDDVFVQENDLDTFFDELNVSRIDFGGGLSKKMAKSREVVHLQSIAFCDQTDILSGPIGIKHYFSPDQLLSMADKGWGKESNGATVSLEELIKLSRDEKKDDNTEGVNKTPGRYIEIYEVHGNLPKKFANKEYDGEAYETRLFICAFYQKQNTDGLSGVILYSAPETKSPFKIIKRDPVYGRGLGFGGAEELFEAQVWVNYDMIRKQNMLDAASITVLGASGTGSTDVTTRNNVVGMKNLEIIDLGEAKLAQIDTFPRNMQLFDKSVADWEAHAQQMGAANDSILGQAPTAGTPFKLQELVTAESHGLHEYRRGQFAKHIEEIYRDDFIPEIQKEITNGFKFLSELSLEELQYVTDCVITYEANKTLVKMVMAGQQPTPDQQELVKQAVRAEFQKKGNKHFLEALKGEFKDTMLGVKVTVKGKSKDLSGRTDKLVNIFRQIIVNPAVLKIPAIGKIFNDILESSGLNPADFSGITKEQLADAQQPQQPQLPQGQSAPQGQPTPSPFQPNQPVNG